MVKYHRSKLRTRDDAMMPVLELGRGPRSVVMIPGAGDGLTTVYDSARRLSWFYRRRAPHFKMHIISRRDNIPSDHSIEDHARDYIEAIDQLGLRSIVLECNSAGGFIGQQIAVQRPDLVDSLILASTAHRIDDRATAIIKSWLRMAEDRRWAELGWDSTLKTYRMAERFRWAGPLMKPALALSFRPKDPNRTVHLLRGLLGVDNTEILDQISSPTLVFGGSQDPIFSSALQRQMADRIPDCWFVEAEGYLHGADLESPLYSESVASFVNEKH